MKKILLCSVAILSCITTARADEISDIQAQAKELREQMTRRLADLEKRQKALEAQKAAVPTISPVDAMAADLPYKAAVKAKPPESDDLCIHGICVYGALDMGIMYDQRSLPYAPMSASPTQTVISKNAFGSYFGTGANQLQSSFIGLRGKQEIADNLYAVFNLQSLFNPSSGMSANGIGSVAQNNGLPVALQNGGGDSSKAGQMFNQVAYFGVSSPTYGTFTMGRQTTLSNDVTGRYDPVGGNSWSVLGFLGADGGGGQTENRIYDNSYEYRVDVGPVRLAAIAQARSGGNSGTGNAFQGNVGFDYMGLSVDFVGGKIYDAIGSGAMSAAQVATATAANIATGTGWVSATASDNTAFLVAGRYTLGPWKFYGGYEHISYDNPNNPLAMGAFIEGGYIAGAVNNTAYTNQKVLQTVWLGTRYAITPNLDIGAAWYHEWQNSYATGANTGCTTTVASQCAGYLDAVSLVADWRFARHMDMYAGVMWSQAVNGWASGYQSLSPGSNKASTYDPGIGLRYQF